MRLLLSPSSGFVSPDFDPLECFVGFLPGLEPTCLDGAGALGVTTGWTTGCRVGVG